MTNITVGDYLLLRLVQIGVKHIFGVPGDYNMEFLDRIVAQDNLKWIGNCNELNAAYAADGYARINGIAALVTTFGVGELSAINGIAGAYAEYVPVVAITGSPATKKQSSGAPLHHTLGTGDFTMFARMFEKVTAAQASLTPENATAEIDRVLSACLLKKQPVYINLPMDVASHEVAAPSGEFMPPVFQSERTTLDEAIAASVSMLEKAEKPVILADIGVDRYRLHNELRELLAATGYPFATLSMAKALLEETHPQYIGIYNGAVSDNYVRRRIEEADCVLSIGTYLTDFNTGKFSAQLDPGRSIEVHGQYLKIKRALYNNVAMQDFLPALSKQLKHRDAISLDIKPAKENLNAGFTTSFQPNSSAAIKQERFWLILAHFLKEDDIVVAEIGVAFFGALLVPFPKGTTFVGQLLWAAIGYSLGAVLGCAIASPERRSILLIGDGSFQMTAQELSTILRYNLKPIIFLINNDGYTIERDIHGEKMPYNDIQPWNYHQLPEVFGNNSWSIKVREESELESALEKAEQNQDKLAFIEVVMDKMDNPENLLKLLQQ
jgi:pyruvate decarboxylase/indolepyruvate decarboxylase